MSGKEFRGPNNLSQTYLRTAAVGFDEFVAALLLDRNDLTISSACGLVRRGPAAAAPMQLHEWQVVFLRVVGAALDYFFPGHCEGAIRSDISRANSSLMILRS